MEFTGERFIPNYPDKQIEIEHLQRYYSIANLVKGKIVVDAACGEGYGSFFLSKSAEKVIGIDISDEAISNAQLKYKESQNIKFIQGSVDSLTMLDDNSIDVFVSFETIEHINEQQQLKFIAEVTRVLKDDGIFLISTPDKYWYTDWANHNNTFHVKEFYKEEFKTFLEGFFANIQFFYQKFEVLSIVANNNSNYVNHIALDGDLNLNQGKYIIAICSKKDIGDIDFSSIISIKEITYNNLITRITSLQEEVEERNIHIHNLDQRINDLDYQQQTHLQEKEIQMEKIEKCKEEIVKQKEDIIMQKEEILKQKEEILKQKEEILKQKNEWIEQKERFNEQSKALELKSEDCYQKNKQLEEIIHSDMWRFFSKYYKIRDQVIPPNSKRKLIAKLLKRSLKEPRAMLSKINMGNFKKFRYYLNTDKNGLLEERIDNYLNRFNATETTSQQLFLVDDDIELEKLVFPIYENPKVTIIIPVYNQWRYTYACLKSILLQTPGIPYEVIIADDVSTDDTMKINEYVDNITVVRDEINRGFLLNCNNAATYAKGAYIFLLNNDTNVQANYLDSLVELIESDKRIGMVGSKLVYPDGRLQEAGGIIWNDAGGWNYGRLDEPDTTQYNYVKEVDYISGAAIMIRRELWESIGGFDERYVPAYFEDSDLAFEVRKHGYKVLLQPKSVVVHFEGISHGTNTNTGIKGYQIKNKEKFIEKWGEVLKSEHFADAHNVYWARDRSQFKKTLLIIDHYVPHFDKDAGSRTVYQYVKLFVEMGFNVKFVGDNYYNHQPYTSILEQLGVEVFYGNWYASHFKEWLKLNGQYIDYAFLNRPHITEKYIDQIKKYTKAKIIYYGHDLHFLREIREYRLTNNPELLKSSEKWKEIEFDIFSKSDVVYYPSQVEVDEIKQYLPELNIKAIPAYIFDTLKGNIKAFSEREDLLFVGGFGHKPNIDAVLWFIQEVFPAILNQYPDMKIYIVGSNPPELIKNLQAKNIIITGFVTDERLEQYYNDCKIVVVPLTFGAGVKGKVVEALYHGIPIVTTSVGSEGLPNIASYVLESDEGSSFAGLVNELYVDNERLELLSAQSINYVQKYFSKQSVLKIISHDFELKGNTDDY
ncbi:glycosyltransferase [Paenibacillus psychroresistens]|uniref:Glycosyltransferase n=1 Tax=Paenibacillus psychroresistens TaxID=1778678 RepID=A0A6B8RR94_9BACL|nr:glycosyltransferase [Paenibacillus psychroresistens]QGQ98489.1 glycosyltransferase [Paenibacillus psychroresistens]